MKRHGLMGLILAAGLALSACGGAETTSSASAGAGGHVDITLWHTQSGANGETLGAMVNLFNLQHPNITVKSEFAGNYDDEYKKLLAAAKGGGLPDLAVAYENVVADLMKGNVIVPLDSYVNGKGGLSKESLDDIFPGYIETNRFKQFNNQMLSFPFTKSQLMAYYNTDMLTAAGVTKAPTTWDEYSSAMKKVTDYAKAKALPFTGADALNLDASTIDFKILSRGGKLMSDDQTKVAFNNDQALAVFQLDADLYKAGAAYIPNGFDWEADLAAQKTVARLDSSTGYAFLTPLFQKAPTQFNWVTTPPPNSGQPLTVMYGANVAMFKSTPDKQAAAWQFIQWFTDTDQTATWSIKTHYLPVRKSAANNADFKKELAANASLKASFDFLQYARPEPNVAGWQQIRDILHDAETSVVTGKATAKAALDDAEAKANKALADAK